MQYISIHISLVSRCFCLSVPQNTTKYVNDYHYHLHSLLSMALEGTEVFRLIKAKRWTIAEERYSLRTILRSLRTPQIHSICLYHITIHSACLQLYIEYYWGALVWTRGKRYNNEVYCGPPSPQRLIIKMKKNIWGALKRTTALSRSHTHCYFPMYLTCSLDITWYAPLL